MLSSFLQPLALTPVSSAFLSLEETVRHYASSMAPGIARGTLEFLGVGFDERVLRFHEHARTRRVKSPSYADVVKPVYRTALGRWRRYEQHLAPHLGELARFVEELGYS